MRGLVHIGDGKLELRDLPAVSAGERGGSPVRVLFVSEMPKHSMDMVR